MTWQTVVVFLLVFVPVMWIVVKGILNWKNGRTTCSSSCGACACRDACHAAKKDR